METAFGPPAILNQISYEWQLLEIKSSYNSSNTTKKGILLSLGLW